MISYLHFASKEHSAKEWIISGHRLCIYRDK